MEPNHHINQANQAAEGDQPLRDYILPTVQGVQSSILPPSIQATNF